MTFCVCQRESIGAAAWRIFESLFAVIARIFAWFVMGRLMLLLGFYVIIFILSFADIPGFA